MTSTWTGNVSGNLEAAGNWDNGVPGVGDTAVIGYPGIYDPDSGTCVAGTVNINNGSFISGPVTFTGAITLQASSGRLRSGSITSGSITCNGEILGGTHSGTVTVNDSGNGISGGTFTGTVNCAATASIAGGTFSGVFNGPSNTDLMGGTFTGTMIVPDGRMRWISSVVGVKALSVRGSPLFTLEKGIGGAGILGMV